MEQNLVMLSATVILGALAILFAIIGVATSGWSSNGGRLFGCAGESCGHNYTAAGVLLIIAIIVLVIAAVITILFLTEYIKASADRIKALVLALFLIAGIFIITAYSRTVSNDYYSYHLTVTAGVLTFLSAIFFTYWIGHTSIVLTH